MATPSPITSVDIVFVLVILISAGLAFLRGFVRESLSVGAWVVAGWLAFTQYDIVAPYFEGKIASESIRNFAGGVCIFLGVLLVFIPITFYIRSFVKGDHITAIDRSFGFLFGAARGFLLLSLLYWGFSLIVAENKQDAWLKDAATRPLLSYGANKIKAWMPEEDRTLLEKNAKIAREKREKEEAATVADDNSSTTLPPPQDSAKPSAKGAHDGMTLGGIIDHIKDSLKGNDK